MASPESSPKSLAFIHNTCLPHPLGVLSTAIASFIEGTCIRPHIPFNYNITVLDLAHYVFPSPSSPATSRDDSSCSTPIPQPNLKSQAESEEEISQHDGLIVLFPYHTWSHCSSFKTTLSPPFLSTNSLSRKPILLLGFGKQEPFCATDYNRTWKRKSFPMMKEFCEQRGMKVIDVEVPEWVADEEGQEARMKMGYGFPEFQIFEDYWEDWVKGGPNAWLGGQQVEKFEGRGWNRCVVGVGKLVGVLEGRESGKGKRGKG
ncbi:hypothetical protein EG329_005073 [Mollisiaceae sp. DMI_Dod_QoI]|nr:hypothetical protein EG329_005073 [Helotiales sp. DMI_Dod_QoI]